MPPAKTSFLDKVLGRLTRLDTENVRTLLHRLAEERSLLETIFNIVEDGILVVAEDGGVQYLDQSALRLLGLPESARGGETTIQNLLPELDWEKLAHDGSKGRKPRGPSGIRSGLAAAALFSPVRRAD